MRACFRIDFYMLYIYTYVVRTDINIDNKYFERKITANNDLKGTATKRSITQHLRHKTYLLLNVAAHNVTVTKRKSYKT
jgi:hypothetical protein